MVKQHIQFGQTTHTSLVTFHQYLPLPKEHSVSERWACHISSRFLCAGSTVDMAYSQRCIKIKQQPWLLPQSAVIIIWWQIVIFDSSIEWSWDSLWLLKPLIKQEVAESKQCWVLTLGAMFTDCFQKYWRVNMQQILKFDALVPLDNFRNSLRTWLWHVLVMMIVALKLLPLCFAAFNSLFVVVSWCNCKRPIHHSSAGCN